MDLVADILLVLHFCYFIFCVGGEAAVLLGFFFERIRSLHRTGVPVSAPRRGLGWVRNRVFRLAHLVAVGIVGAEGLLGVLCPLTVLEYALRRAAGQTVETEIPLVTRIIRSLLFYDFPFWVFTILYVGFAVLVAATYVLVPPEKK